MKKAFADEIKKMKMEILKQIHSATEASENHMLDSIRTHIGDILKHLEAESNGLKTKQVNSMKASSTCSNPMD
jgi:hypothetical protein